MARPLTRAQNLQNAAFLKALRRTGNIRLAAREIGMAYGTVQHRRGAHPAFAQRIDAALAFAQAKLSEAGRQGPVAKPRSADVRRTQGGEPVVVRRNDGKLQMRAAQPGKLTRDCEQAFLSALSATANVRLSAAAAGASVAAFYRRRRNHPGFAREMRLALERGYERLECALLDSFDPMSHSDDAWRHNDPPPIPSMTAAQALQLLYLHQKEARLLAEPTPMRRRRGETREAVSMRLSLMYEAAQERGREDFRIAEAARLARGEPTHIDRSAEGVTLPDLSQVTGWSKAKPDGAGVAETARVVGTPGRATHKTDAALFGGWRLR